MNKPLWERILNWLLGAALIALVFWMCCGSAHSAPVPTFKHLPHYMTRNHCDPFSKVAVAYLENRGIPAVRITYGWSRVGGPQGYHAAVLFQWEGKLYFMDNDRMGARPVAGKTDWGCASHISADFYTFVWMVNEDNERVPKKPVAELFEAARLLRAYRAQSKP